jgi:hypothetical protein
MSCSLRQLQSIACRHGDSVVASCASALHFSKIPLASTLVRSNGKHLGVAIEDHVAHERAERLLPAPLAGLQSP